MKQIVLFLLMLLGWSAGAQAAERNTEVKLLLSHSTAQPGMTITGALEMVSKPGWHTYWKNPGDAGLPATIEWELPAGWSAGSMEFPTPQKLIISRLFAYVYEGRVLLLMPLSIPPNAASGPVTLKGQVSWLECDDKTCLPQDAAVSATLTIGSEAKASASADLIATWRERLPEAKAPFQVDSSWEASTNADSRSLLIEWVPNAPVEKPDFFPGPSESFSAAGATKVLEASPQKVRLRKSISPNEKTLPRVISGLILNQTGKEAPKAYAVELRPTGGGVESMATAANAPAAIQLGGGGKQRSVLAILGLAFLGGLILNIMPCVLPVIALKILGFVNQAQEHPKRVRELGLIYMMGVLASFLVLAGLIISVKKATGAANWGFQMQNPYFVVGMTVLVTLVALNLFGVFEITLGGGAMGAATGLASREGRAGAFYNGVLATLLATPCTAPALGAAVGAVITQPSSIIILVFLMIGFGLALPYVLLSWNPRWLKLLPKPGKWMEKFKMSMGFPMLATAIWLLSVASNHFGKSGSLWLGLFLVCVAAAAWIWGDFVQRGSRNRGFAMALAAIFLFGGYAYALEGKLQWREARTRPASGSDIAIEPGGIQWRKWTPEAVAEARAAGHPVLVDFTADWCLTCQVNKSTSIEIDSVKQKIKEIGAVPLLADFTLKNPKISEELRRFKRAGVPLVVVFPSDPNGAPILLPELLTPGIVLEALEMAAGQGAGKANLSASR